MQCLPLCQNWDLICAVPVVRSVWLSGHLNFYLVPFVRSCWTSLCWVKHCKSHGVESKSWQKSPCPWFCVWFWCVWVLVFFKQGLSNVAILIIGGLFSLCEGMLFHLWFDEDCASIQQQVALDPAKVALSQPTTELAGVKDSRALLWIIHHKSQTSFCLVAQLIQLCWWYQKFPE